MFTGYMIFKIKAIIYLYIIHRLAVLVEDGSGLCMLAYINLSLSRSTSPSSCVWLCVLYIINILFKLKYLFTC